MSGDREQHSKMHFTLISVVEDARCRMFGQEEKDRSRCSVSAMHLQGQAYPGEIRK